MEFILNIQPFLIALFIGLASGAVGSFIILRRMALVGDALSHVALPGIALALFYGLDPFWGVLSFLVLAAVLVWWLEGRSRLPTDAIVGMLFTASLAVGVLTIPDHEILESLFGTFPEMSGWVLGSVLVAALAASVVTFVLARKIIFSTVAPDMARVSGIGRKYDLWLFLIFSLVVALGIKLVGTLLMGALTIIPAAVSKNLSKSMTEYMVLSAVLGGMISLGGLLVSVHYGILPGPVIILLGSAVFLLSLSFARK